MMMDEKPILDDGQNPIPGEYGHPIPRELMFRELGFNGPFSRHSIGKAIVSATLKTKAVHTMSTKNVIYKKNFKLPSGARTTFHLAFSPDGTKVASCHGDHNVYVSDITTMEVEQTLSGHPRTPWCVVFHPTQNDILASGCLAGHVRVWDLNGGSELLVCDSGTVIASLSFHPTVRLLAIATFNEIIFWDWALGPFPLARTSTGNVKEKVRLIRFDRLGHNIVTGITNFPNPPVGGPLSTADGTSEGNNAPFPNRSRSAFFRPNILSRTPQPTQTSQPMRRPYTPPPTLGLEEDEVTPSSATLAMTDLSERQERFQESYRQLVHHYEELVQHYQHFIRSRLGVPETPPQPPVIEYFPASDLEDPNIVVESPHDPPPIDIVISENPSHNLPTTLQQELNPIVQSMMVDEVPGPSTRVFQPSTSARVERNPPQPSTSRGSVGRDPEVPRNNNDLRSIQTLEQNILQMQNLCMQARRDSSNFPVEPVHIQELRTIRRHLEVLQDQTRRLQSSIRHTLSSLAHGTGGLEGLRGRLTSLIPPSHNPTSSSLATTVTPVTLDTAETVGYTGRDMPIPQAVNFVEDIIGRTIQNALGGQVQARLARGQRLLPPGMELPSTSSLGPRPNAEEDPNAPEPPPNRQLPRFPREFFADTLHEHSRFCPYGDGGIGRPHARMRCVSELGQNPVLSIWPTVETGHEQSVHSFRLSRDETRRREGGSTSRSVVVTSATTDRNNNGEGGFPSFGSWMGEGPGWINNDLGVRVYLTVRQFNERINSLRNERDQLLAERDDLLARRARATTQLARAQQAARARESDIPENWQRNFNSGVALVPSNVREGSRNYRITRRGIRMPEMANMTVTTSSSSSAATSSSSDTTTRNENQNTGRRADAAASNRRLPPRLDGNFQRISSIRLGEELVPVYGHLREREVPQQNVFVFPIGLFLEGNGWPSSSVAIYWPNSSREEEESMGEYRRTESLVPVFTYEADRVPDERYAGFALEYDSTRLVLHIREGLSLIFIQPGLPLLDATTTMASFPRPRENSGRVYINHVTPFLDSVQRLFGTRRRGGGGGNSGGSSSSGHGQATLRLSTVLQPGPFSMGRGVQYSMRARRMDQGSGGGGGGGGGGGPSRAVQTEEGGSAEGQGGENGVPIHHHVNVRLRRDLLRDWERSLSLYRSATQPSTATPATPRQPRPPPGNSTMPMPPVAMTENQERVPSWDDDERQREADWPIRDEIPDSTTAGSNQAEVDFVNGADSASLASTRRVIRLAVATAASSVLRRTHVLTSYAAPTINSFATTASRAVESRIERVLNERGNRGDMDTGPNPQIPENTRESMEVVDGPWLSASTTQGSRTTGGSRDNEVPSSSSGRNSSGYYELPASVRHHLSLRGVTVPAVDDRGAYFLRLRPLQGTSSGPGGEDVRGVVTTARPLRRSYAQMTGNHEGSDSDSDESESPMMRRMRVRRGEQARPEGLPATTFRRRSLRSPESRLRLRYESDAIGGSMLRRMRDVAGGRNTNGPANVSNGTVSEASSVPTTVDRELEGRSGTGGDTGPPFLLRRDRTDRSAPSTDVPRQVYYRRRIGGREYGGGMTVPPPPEEIPVGARFYPGYIPEIVITPRARPPNYYTLDASTTAFLSSRIQKWDFSTFEIPKLELRDEGVVVRECSLHSDACLDLSSDGDFMAVCIPSDSGSYSAIGIYSIRDESLGDVIHMFNFDQNTVSVSIAPSSDYLVVGYAGRGGPLYRFVQHTRAIGQILSLTRDGDGGAKLVSVKELFTTDNQSTVMSVNCMHWVPVSGYGIIYGTNTGELVLLS